MGIALAIALVLMNLIVHEMSHAYAMARYGVELEKAGIGIPVPGLTVTLRLPRLSVPVTFSPLLLIAYVKPTDKGQKQLDALPYEKKATIFGVGILSNAVISALLLPVYLYWIDWQFSAVPMVLWILLGGVAAIGLLGIVMPRKVSAYVLPVSGIVMMAGLVWMLAPGFMADPGYAVTHGGAVVDGAAQVGGPVMIARLIGQASDPIFALVLGMMIGNGLAVANMLPLPPFDGGHISRAYLTEMFGPRVAKAVSTVLAFVGLFFIFMVLAGDVMSFF